MLKHRLLSGWSMGCLAIIGLLFQGCTLFAPQPRTISSDTIGQEFELYEAVVPPMDQWWESFESEELNQLVERALEGNLTLAQSYARLQQANSTAVKSGAARFPELSASWGYTNTRQKVDLDSEMDGTTTTDRYSGGLSIASYELDLWGRVNSNRNAALKEWGASREDLRTAMISITAETVTRWLDMIVQKQTLSLLQEQLETNRQSLQLMDARYRLGQSGCI